MQPSMRAKMFPRATGTVLGALACGALLLVLDTSCQQPKMYCTTAHAYYAAKYELKTGDPMSQCGSLKGELLGMNTYFATGGVNGTPKFNQPSVAIRSELSGTLFEHAQHYVDQAGAPVPVPGLEDDPKDPDDYDHMPNAFAKFDRGEPDDEDFCHAKKVGPAVLELPELPAIPAMPDLDDPETPDVDEGAEIPATPAIRVIHEWTDARWLVNPNAQGTQFEADLKLTIDNCTAEYHVVALAPAIECAEDKDCTTEGVGINPDFAVRCDADFGFCVLAEDLPSFK